MKKTNPMTDIYIQSRKQVVKKRSLVTFKELLNALPWPIFYIVVVLLIIYSGDIILWFNRLIVGWIK